jgi:hypothetical protein
MDYRGNSCAYSIALALARTVWTELSGANRTQFFFLKTCMKHESVFDGLLS